MKSKWPSHKTPPGGHHRIVSNIYLHRKNKSEEWVIQWVCVDPEGPRTALAAAFLIESLKRGGFQMCILRMNKCGKVFKFVSRIPTRTY